MLLFRAAKQVAAPELEELARRRLAKRLESRQRRHRGNGGSSEKVTSVHCFSSSLVAMLRDTLFAAQSPPTMWKDRREATGT